MLLCYVIDSGLSTSLLLLATLIIMFYITLHLHLHLHRYIFLLTSFSLPFNELSLVGLALDMVD